MIIYKQPKRDDYMKDISLSKQKLTKLKKLLKKTKPATISEYRAEPNYNLYEKSSAIQEERRTKARLIEYYRELIQKEIEILNKGEEHPRNIPEGSPFKYDYMNTDDDKNFAMFIQKTPHKNITKEDLELALETIINFIMRAPIKAYPTSFCKLSEYILYLKCRELFKQKDKESLEKASVMYNLVKHAKYFQEEYVFKQKKRDSFLKVEMLSFSDAFDQYQLLRNHAFSAFELEFSLLIIRKYKAYGFPAQERKVINLLLDDSEFNKPEGIREVFYRIFDEEYRKHNGTFEMNVHSCDSESLSSNPWGPLLKTIKNKYRQQCLSAVIDKGIYDPNIYDRLKDEIDNGKELYNFTHKDIDCILSETCTLTPVPKPCREVIKINGDCLKTYISCYGKFSEENFLGRPKTYLKRRKI